MRATKNRSNPWDSVVVNRSVVMFIPLYTTELYIALVKCAIQFYFLFMLGCRYSYSVKKKENTPAKRAYGLGMKAQMFRFPPRLIERLTRAATKAQLSKSGYVVMALEEQLKKDGIK